MDAVGMEADKATTGVFILTGIYALTVFGSTVIGGVGVLLAEAVEGVLSQTALEEGSGVVAGGGVALCVFHRG
ncbi:Major facilitator transporter [human gut metagenome]|uniref:Major facilitator transporter n=1 Tax=human gut metagenome TaxID=408170 RepID=W1YLU4_9ZZZZ